METARTPHLEDSPRWTAKGSHCGARERPFPLRILPWEATTRSLRSWRHDQLTWDKTVINERLAKWAVKEFLGAGIKTSLGTYKAPMGLYGLLKRGVVTRDDLHHEALLAIHKAWEGFDESLGYKFSTYAAPVIGEALKKAAGRMVDPLKC
jgi:hypothetical protein